MNAAGDAAEPRLLVISGTSGSGKTTVAGALLRDPRYGRARTATTRPARAGEVDGIDYDFLTEDAFRAGIERGDFVEHAVVYGRLYGTPRANLEAILDSGRNCVLVVDVQGVRNLRRQAIEAFTVFVEAPSPEELRRRLESRGKDDPDTIERRLEAAAKEREEAESFDLVLVNDVVESAVQRLVAHAGLDWTPHDAEE